MATAAEHTRNPMSLHRPGRRARVGLDSARQAVQRACGAERAEVIFTSGGTESDHLGLRGLAKARLRTHGLNRVLLSNLEHPAIVHAACALRKDGFDIQEIPSIDGILDLRALELALDESVAVMGLMFAHNTTGIVQPVQAASKMAQSVGVPVHVDAVQALGKIPVQFYELGATTLALSAHKFGGPRGVGALVTQKCIGLDALWSGGGQEEGKRSGSHAHVLVAGMAAALDAIDIQEHAVAHLRDQLETNLLSDENWQVVGKAVERLPNTSAMVLEGMDSREFVREMDKLDIAVSAGAACHAKAGGTGPQGQVRFSLAHTTTQQHVDEAGIAARRVAAKLRSKP